MAFRKWQLILGTALLTVVLGRAVGLGGASPSAPRSYRVFLASKPPDVDGELKDECWRAVPWETKFTRLGGGEPEVQTQFAMAWREHWLYICIRVLEPRIEEMKADHGNGDMGLFQDDHIEIMLGDPKDKGRYFQIAVNPEAARLDIAWNDKSRVGYQQLERSGEWSTACQEQAMCWTVEMAVPLNQVGLAAQEGGTFRGNVCRTRTVGGPDRHSTWTPLGERFQEPERFATFTFAGKPGPAEAARSLAEKEDLDALQVRGGDRLVGKVMGVGSDGVLSLKGAQYEGVVRVRASDLVKADFGPAASEVVGAMVHLTTGDRLVGRLVGLTDDALLLAEGLLGSVSIPRDRLARVDLDRKRAPEVVSRFEEGDLRPWGTHGSGWQLGPGGLVFQGRPQNRASLFLKSARPEAVTLVVEFDRVGRQSIHCQILLRCDSFSPRNIRNGIAMQLYSGGYRLYTRHNGRFQQISQHPAHKPFREGELRYAHDPIARRVRVWFGNEPAGEFEGVGAPAGNHIVLIPQRPIRFRRITVLSGVVPPRPTGEAAADSTHVRLVNGDEVTGTGVVFSAGRFVVQSDYGKIRLPSDRVSSIRFSRRVDEPLPLGDGVVRAYTRDGRLTMKLNEMTQNDLVGETVEFGPVRLPRDAVRHVLFRTPEIASRETEEDEEAPTQTIRLQREIPPDILVRLPARILERLLVGDRKQ